MTENNLGNKEEADSALKDSLEGDKVKRIGSSHGDATYADEKTGYARDIGQEGQVVGGSREPQTKGVGLTSYAKKHPSRNLNARSDGFGIGGGYERPYREEKRKTADEGKELYGPLPHSGYYGTGVGRRPFNRGQASFSDELCWYQVQYGKKTSGYDREKKS